MIDGTQITTTSDDSGETYTTIKYQIECGKEEIDDANTRAICRRLDRIAGLGRVIKGMVGMIAYFLILIIVILAAILTTLYRIG